MTKKLSNSKLEKDAIRVPGNNSIVFVKVNNASLECVDVAILVIGNRIARSRFNKCCGAGTMHMAGIEGNIGSRHAARPSIKSRVM